MIRTLLVPIAVFAFAACNAPPEGVHVQRDGSAFTFGPGVVVDGGGEAEPPPPEAARWLAENGYVFDRFVPDTTGPGRLLHGRIESEGADAYWGRSVWVRE